MKRKAQAQEAAREGERRGGHAKSSGPAAAEAADNSQSGSKGRP